MPNDTALFPAKLQLCLFDAEELVVTAKLFYTLVEHNKVMEEVEESPLLENAEQLPVQLIGKLFALFKYIKRNHIQGLCIRMYGVVFPFQIILLQCLNRAVPQALAAVACHHKLHRGKEGLIEMFILV